MKPSATNSMASSGKAYLIARRILDWMGKGKSWQPQVRFGSSADRGSEPAQSRPIEYRDIVILLRSLPHKAAPIADILRRMGIPVRIDRQAGGLEGTEFNDVLSLLQVLDNPQQDIPLAAVLRSSRARRAVHRERAGRDPPHRPRHSLSQRRGARMQPAAMISTCGRFGGHAPAIERYRQRMRQRPVAEVLWEILSQYALPRLRLRIPRRLAAAR